MPNVYDRPVNTGLGLGPMQGARPGLGPMQSSGLGRGPVQGVRPGLGPMQGVRPVNPGLGLAPMQTNPLTGMTVEDLQALMARGQLDPRYDPRQAQAYAATQAMLQQQRQGVPGRGVMTPAMGTQRSRIAPGTGIQNNPASANNYATLGMPRQTYLRGR